jgi:6-pyruvoyltetrahydropterin/6-carboxytetrahydropterin synthase
MYEISKEFEFDFGHRVWNQELDVHLSCGKGNKCRFLHGHRGKILIYLQNKSLEKGMVTDFNHLAWFKKWIDDYFDHKFLLDEKDPFLSDLREKFSFSEEYIPNTNIKRTIGDSDYLNSFVIVPFTPTAENLSKFIFNLVKETLPEISRVEFFETVKAKAIYYER